MIEFQKDVLLSHHTTIGLGGRARYFVVCNHVDEIRAALVEARREGLRVQVLGGGSNLIFSDDGFNGLVLKIDLQEFSLDESGEDVIVTAGAGNQWDEFVLSCIERDLSGIECLSGIPGLVGATPIQNVGAYGQEVSDVIREVQVLDRRSLVGFSISASDCMFGYRSSRFKGSGRDQYIVTSVNFSLKKNGKPILRYPELEKYVRDQCVIEDLAPGSESLLAVRNAVIALRRKKSMVIDPDDPNSKSVGSFFMNPVLAVADLLRLETEWRVSGDGTSVPTFPAVNGVKISAAWLIEKSGFRKGMSRKGVGISTNHSLALVNQGGRTADLLSLGEEIQNGVLKKFGVRLEREPIVIT